MLETMVNRHLQEQQLMNNRPMRKFHPSTIGFCQRRIVFDMMMVPKMDADPQLMRIFENGHSMHHRFETMFKEMGVLVEAEMKIEADDISGHTDALIRIRNIEKPLGEYYLVELKSASYQSFKWMIEKNQPKKEHKAQLMFYLHMVRKNPHLKSLNKGIIFVECKDDQRIWEHHITYDPDYGEYLEKRAKFLIQQAKRRKLPKAPEGHTPSYHKCKECPYHIYCHAASVTRENKLRYPNPAQPGSVLEHEINEIIQAVKEERPIPNVISGKTSGELSQEVMIKNQTPYRKEETIPCNL